MSQHNHLHYKEIQRQTTLILITSKPPCSLYILSTIELSDLFRLNNNTLFVFDLILFSCTHGYTGAKCEQRYDLCDRTNPCVGENNTCEDNVNGIKCICEQGRAPLIMLLLILLLQDAYLPNDISQGPWLCEGRKQMFHHVTIESAWHILAYIKYRK